MLFLEFNNFLMLLHSPIYFDRALECIISLILELILLRVSYSLSIVIKAWVVKILKFQSSH